MLPLRWRFVVHNKSGVTLDFSTNSANEKANAEFVRGIVNPADGLVDYDTEVTRSAGTDLATGLVEGLTEETAQERVRVFGTFHVETDNASAAGDVILGVEHRPDASAAWPSDGASYDPDTDLTPVAVITLGGAETHDANFSF